MFRIKPNSSHVVVVTDPGGLGPECAGSELASHSWRRQGLIDITLLSLGKHADKAHQCVCAGAHLQATSRRAAAGCIH